MALERANVTLDGALHHIKLTRVVGKRTVAGQKWLELIKHFSKVRLCAEDFEYPDLLGAAYEYLIGDFADSAGKKAGEFYTPRSVVRLMVRIADPQVDMKVYDPCSGSGGMLIFTAEHVAEHGGNPQKVGLYGQENAGAVWSMSKMNMILHGIPWAILENADTPADPKHKNESGSLKKLDRVLSNPPFSQTYKKEGMLFQDRFRWWCPENSKKADLMFVQHMLAVLEDDGMVCTVLKQDGYNLNIRRYGDNAPPPEPQDVRSHLSGGVYRRDRHGVVGAKRTAWHFYFCILPRRYAPGAFEVRHEVPLSEEPPRMDYLILRRAGEPSASDPGETLIELWPLLRRVTIAELKTVPGPYEKGNLDRLWMYCHGYYAGNHKGLADRNDMCALLIVPNRTPTLDDDARAMALRWEDLGHGYWRICGGKFPMYVAEIEMQELEGYEEAIRKILKALPPELRLADLSPEQAVLAMPVDLLRGLSAEYLSTLPETTRAEIVKRLARS